MYLCKEIREKANLIFNADNNPYKRSINQFTKSILVILLFSTNKTIVNVSVHVTFLYNATVFMLGIL